MPTIGVDERRAETAGGKERHLRLHNLGVELDPRFLMTVRQQTASAMATGGLLLGKIQSGGSVELGLTKGGANEIAARGWGRRDSYRAAQRALFGKNPKEIEIRRR